MVPTKALTLVDKRSAAPAPINFLSWTGRIVLVVAVLGCSTQERPLPRRESTSTSSRENAAALDRLLGLMGQRLELMHLVAQAKWNAGLPIEDRQREQALLESLTTQGQQHQLSPELVRDFFAAQIQASKKVQEADFQRWRPAKQGQFVTAPQLAELRDQIDRLNRNLLAALAQVAPQLGTAGFRDLVAVQARVVLTGPGIDDEVRNLALAPLTGRTGQPTP